MTLNRARSVCRFTVGIEAFKGKFQKGGFTSVARVIELSATSEQGFEEAINEGINRATTTLRNVESAWVKDMNVEIENDRSITYRVNLAITFVLEEGERPASSG